MKHFSLSLLISFLLLFNGIFAQTKTFIKDYTYTAGEADSKLTSRAIALEQVKRYLLEELGVYVETTFETIKSETKEGVKDLSKQQIKSISAGITETKILEEKWNGETYYIKAQLTVDIGEFKKSLENIAKDAEKTKQLAELQEKSDKAFAELEQLKKDFTNVKSENDKLKIQQKYSANANELTAADWYQKAYNAYEIKEYDNTILYAKKSLELNPNDQWSYNLLGLAYHYKKAYTKAIESYNKMLSLDAKNVVTYNNLAVTVEAMGDTLSAIENYKKALSINPNYVLSKSNIAISLANLALSSYNKREYSKSIELYTDAINMDPKPYMYFNIGLAYYNIFNYEKATINFEKAIEKEPKYKKNLTYNIAECYYNIANKYFKSNNTPAMVYNYKKAAIYEHKGCIDWLLKCGYAFNRKIDAKENLKNIQITNNPIGKNLICNSEILNINLKSEKGYLYGIGISYANSDLTEAVKQADDLARIYLSFAVHSDIKDISKGFSDNDNGYYERVFKMKNNNLIAKSSIEVVDHYYLNNKLVISLARVSLNDIKVIENSKMFQAFSEIINIDKDTKKASKYLEFGASVNKNTKFYSIESGEIKNNDSLYTYLWNYNKLTDSLSVDYQGGNYTPLYYPKNSELIYDQNYILSMLPFLYNRCFLNKVEEIDKRKQLQDKDNKIVSNSTFDETTNKQDNSESLFGLRINNFKIIPRNIGFDIFLDAADQKDSIKLTNVKEDGNWKSYK